MRKLNFRLLFVCTVLAIFASCAKKGCTDPQALNYDADATKDDDGCEYVVVPDTYVFTDADGNNTVSYSGQTSRMDMLSEMVSYLKTANGSNTTPATLDANTLLAMYDNSYTGWSDTNLIDNGKQLKSKTALNDAGIQVMFEGWMTDAATGSPDVTGSYLQAASGIEWTQMIEKGLMGACFASQMTSNYLAGISTDDNSVAVDVAAGKYYTEMEHHWDEGYGYLYGLQPDQGVYDLDVTNGDVLLYKYYAKSNFSDIQAPIYDAFKMGREAITMDASNGGTNIYSDVKMREATTIKNHISHIIGQKAYDYLKGAADHLDAGGERNGDFFHGLSEGVGFVVSLQFTYNDGAPHFSYSEVDSMLETLSNGNGLWDITSSELNQMASDIEASFNL